MTKQFNIDKVSSSMTRAYSRKCRKERNAFVGQIVCGSLLTFFCCFLLDYVTNFPAAIRLILTLGNLGYFYGYLVWKRKQNSTIKTTVVEIAKEIELTAQRLKQGGFYSVLVSATEFATAGIEAGSKELRGLVVDQAHQPDYDPNTLVLHDTRLVSRSRKLLLAAVIVYILWGAIGHNSLMTFYGRAFGFPIRYLSRTRIVKVECPSSVAKFENTTITVEAGGVLPSRGRLYVNYEGESTFEVELAPTEKDSTTYVAVVEQPPKNFRLWVKLGDDQTDYRYVDVIRPPFVELGEVTVHPPKYAQLPEQKLGIGSFQMLQGSTFDVSVKPSKEVASCTLEFGKTSHKMTLAEGNYIAKGINVKGSERYSVKLVDDKGIENKERLHYSINVVPDRPPVVSFMMPEQGAYFAPQSIVRWRFKADDDYGMVSAVLKYTVKCKEVIGSEGQIVQESKVLRTGELKLADLNGQKDVEPSGTFVVRDLKVQADQIVEMKLVVSDRCTTRKNKQQGESEIVMINVVSPAELKRIISEELFGAHMMVKDIQTDMESQKKALELRLKHMKRR